MFNHAFDILKIETPKKRKLEDSWATTKKKKNKTGNKLNYRLPTKDIHKKDVHTRKFKPAHIKKNVRNTWLHSNI